MFYVRYEKRSEDQLAVLRYRETVTWLPQGRHLQEAGLLVTHDYYERTASTFCEYILHKVGFLKHISVVLDLSKVTVTKSELVFHR